MSVGITVLPARFTRVAFAGTRTSAARPTAVIRFPVTTMVAFSIGARPVPSITPAPSKTLTVFGACANRAAVVAATVAAARTRSFTRCMVASGGGNFTSEDVRNHRDDSVRAIVHDDEIRSREVARVVARHARQPGSQRRRHARHALLQPRRQLAALAQLFLEPGRKRFAPGQAGRQRLLRVVLAHDTAMAVAVDYADLICGASLRVSTTASLCSGGDTGNQRDPEQSDEQDVFSRGHTADECN